jgi:hypothetical protein
LFQNKDSSHRLIFKPFIGMDLRSCFQVAHKVAGFPSGLFTSCRQPFAWIKSGDGLPDDESIGPPPDDCEQVAQKAVRA